MNGSLHRIARVPALAVLLLALFLPATMRAQRRLPFMTGVRFGVERIAMSPTDSWSFVCGCEPPEHGVVAGGAVVRPLLHLFAWAPSLMTDALGLQIRIGIGTVNVQNEYRLDPTLVLLDGVGVTQEVRAVARYDVRSMMLDALATWRLPFGFVVGMGVSVEHRLRFDVDRMTHLLQPENARFKNDARLPSENNGRTLIFHRGRDERAVMDGLAAMAVLQYPIAIGRHSWVIPELCVRGELREPTGVFLWNRPMFGGGITFATSFKDIDTADEAPPLSDVPAGILHFYGVGSDGARHDTAFVREISVERTRVMRLPPVLYFDAGSPDIPPRYIATATSERVSIDSIARLDPVAAYYHLLDVVGVWMGVHERDTLRLRAAPAPGEAPAVVLARMTVIAAWLADRWGITPARITRTLDSDAVPGAPAVRFESAGGGDPTALGATWTEWRYVPGPIALEPQISGGAEPLRWSLVIMQGGRIVATQTNADSASALRLALPAEGAMSRKGLVPLDALMTMEDGEGRQSAVSARLPLALANGPVAAPQRAGSLVLFADDAPPSEAVAAFMRVLPAGSRIRVTRFGDTVRTTALVATIRVAAANHGVPLEVGADVIATGADRERALPEAGAIASGVTIAFEPGFESSGSDGR